MKIQLEIKVSIKITFNNRPQQIPLKVKVISANFQLESKL